jgi:hypothetical protein
MDALDIPAILHRPKGQRLPRIQINEIEELLETGEIAMKDKIR